MNSSFRRYRTYLYSSGKAVGTIEQRIGDLERFQRSTGIAPDQASADDLLEYMAHGHALWAPQYAKRIRGTLRSYYTWRFEMGLADDDPSAKLPSVKVPKRRHRRPAPDEAVLVAFERGTLEERAILALAAGMGLRRMEIAALPLTARSGKELTVIGKGSKERVLPIDDLTLHLLLEIERQAPDGETYYFRGRFAGTHLHPQTVYSYVKRNMPSESPHTLRHRAGTVGFRRTKDIRATQDFLGHASLATTEIYVELDKRSLSDFTDATSLSCAGEDVQPQLAGLSDLLVQADTLGRLLEGYGWALHLERAPA